MPFLRLTHHGEPVQISPADSYAFEWNGPADTGVYRIEVHLKILTLTDILKNEN